jgi:hypothetical protein
MTLYKTTETFKEIQDAFRRCNYVEKDMFANENVGAILVKEIIDSFEIPKGFIVQFFVEKADWHASFDAIIQDAKNTWCREHPMNFDDEYTYAMKIDDDDDSNEMNQ